MVQTFSVKYTLYLFSAKREPHVVSTCLNCETLKRYNIVNNNKKSKLEDKKKIKAKKTVKEESLIEKKV